jgi:hypothetical protein
MSQPQSVRRRFGDQPRRAILLGWLLGVALTWTAVTPHAFRTANAQSANAPSASATEEAARAAADQGAQAADPALDTTAAEPSTGEASTSSAAAPEPVETPADPVEGNSEIRPSSPVILWRDAPADGGQGALLVEQAPRILFTRDQQGRLRPLVNIPWERIQALLDAEDIGGPQPLAPRFQITNLTAQGQVAGDTVEMSLELRISLPAPAAGDGRVASWTLIPLRFPDASLIGQPEHEGPGKLFVVYREMEGYQAWIQHEQAGEHLIRLRVAMPVDEALGATRLQLLVPAATQSRLELDVPGEQLAVEADGGRRATVSAAPDGRSRIAVSDLRNQLTLAWTKGGDVVAQQPANFDVLGDIRVSVDGPGAIRSQVSLELQSYGRPIERFLLRLPPHTSIVSGNQPGYELRERTVVAGVEEATSAGEPREVEITLLKPAAQARLQLTTQTSHPEGSAARTSVGVFEVPGAIRQSGQITLLASEDWRVDWTLGPSVRRIATPDTLETTGDRRPLATFQYFRQPCRLEVEARPQEARTTVRPRYRMHVEEDRVSLEAQFDYRLRGARIGALGCALNGWILDDIGPSGSVEDAPVEDAPPERGSDTASNGASRQVRLRLTRPTTGDMTLTLRLHRPVTERSGTLRLALPSPMADGVIPGMLLVSAGDAVVLDFRSAEMSGLVPDARTVNEPADEPTLAPPSTTPDERGPAALPPTTPGSPLGSAPLGPTSSAPTFPAEASAAGTAFRFLGDRAPGEVVMDYQVREQEIRVRMDSELEATGNVLQVTQRIGYRVLYRPTSQLKLDVPRPLFELLANPRYRPQVELRLDGQTLGRESFEDVADSVDALRNIVPVNLPLPRPRLGNLELLLRFPWPLRPATTANSLSVPLATPREGRLLSNLATLRDSSPFRLEPSRDPGWVREAPLDGSEPKPGVQLSSPQRTSSLQLQVIASQQPTETTATASSTTIQRAWMQTWLTRERQHERAVLRITTAASRIRVRTAANVRTLDALVDGQAADATRDERSPQEWTIPLASPQAGEHTLELFLEYTSRQPSGSMRFQWPELADASAPRRWFWQLVVPQDEHLWSSDSLLSSANRWQREGIIWRREAVQSQASLEEWTEATSQPPIPPGVHCYLFSSFDPAGTFGIRTCSRRTLVYGFSFLALAIACAWTYLPILRHPIATMACGALLAATAWRYSEQAALVAQASVLGLALAAVPAFVRRWGGTAESAGRRSAAGRGTDGRLVDSRPPELRSTDVHRPDSQRIDARRADSHRGEALPSDPVSNGSHRHVAQELQRTAQDGSAPPTTIRTPGPREPQTPMHAADGPAADHPTPEHPTPDTSAPGVPESRP